MISPDSGSYPDRWADGPVRLVYPIPEVASKLGAMSEREVRRMLARGDLASVTIGRRRYVEHDTLVEFIKQRKAAAE